MTETTTIALNPNENGNIEFDIVIDGLNSKDIQDVRFCVYGENNKFTWMFPCTRIANTEHSWFANVSTIYNESKKVNTFKIEVILDNYYFNAGEGKLIFVSDPQLKFPKVTANQKYLKEATQSGDEVANKIISETLNQEQQNRQNLVDTFERKVEEATYKPITIAAQEILHEANSEITGMLAPNNNLLRPEFKPKDIPSNIYSEDPSKELKKVSPKPAFTSEVRPGGGDPYPEDTQRARDVAALLSKPKKIRGLKNTPLMKHFMNDDMEDSLTPKDRKIKSILKSYK